MGSLQHVMLFELKEPDRVRELSQDAGQLMQARVRSLVTGPRNAVADPMTDRAFDAGIVATFDSSADYREFIAHPAYHAFLERWRECSTNVRVFNFGYGCDAPAARREK